MVPSAERQSRPFQPVEILSPASVDRFPCFHTCPAYEQNFPAISDGIFVRWYLYQGGLPSVLYR